MARSWSVWTCLGEEKIVLKLLQHNFLTVMFDSGQLRGAYYMVSLGHVCKIDTFWWSLGSQSSSFRVVRYPEALENAARGACRAEQHDHIRT